MNASGPTSGERRSRMAGRVILGTGNGVGVNNTEGQREPPEQSVEVPRHTNSQRRIWLGALTTLAVLGLLAAVSVRGRNNRAEHPTSAGITTAMAANGPTTPAARLAVQRRIQGDPLALGQVAAPVVISEWGDFQCPFCRAFNADVAPTLFQRFVDSGQVRFEWHDLAELGNESVLAARAARAAARQGAFWPFHDRLYRDQAPENSGALSETSLTAMAASLGLDTARFSHDFADPAIAAQVDQDGRTAAALGITHVPSFLINATTLLGSQPLPAFQQAVSNELNKER